MTDKEKVIKGLEACQLCECDNCTAEKASHCPWDCEAQDDLIQKAINLLKEHPDETWCDDCAYINEERSSKIINDVLKMPIDLTSEDSKEFACEMIVHRIYHTNWYIDDKSQI